MGDAMDILEFEHPGTPDMSRGSIIEDREFKKQTAAQRKKEEKKKLLENFKRPEGMHRELFNLLLNDNKDPNSPLIPTDILPTIGGAGGGYKQIKAKLGLKKVRPWMWMPFINPGRKDGFKLHHWRRVADEAKEYPFSKFTKSVPIINYTDAEYQQHLQVDNWTKAETDHLFDLCRRFDLRFLIISDRWDKDAFPTNRSIEDIKERYYNAVNTLTKSRSVPGQETKVKVYDSNHERKRKEQLIKQYNRTPEQIEEEQKLIEELRKIELRKKEREKKTQDLQKLITAADNNSITRKSDTPGGPGRPSRGGPGRKKLSLPRVTAKTDSSATGSSVNIESAGIKFPEVKSSGASLRSQRMKLPASVGQKKSKAIEQLLQELNLDVRPMPTEDICSHFNELRSDMVLLYELKMALANCEFELQTLKHQYEAIQPNSATETSATTSKTVTTIPIESVSASEPDTPTTPAPADSKKTISEIIDVGPTPGTPVRKRKAALEQGNMLKKLKNLK